MARIITHADIAGLPDGSVLAVPEDARLTPLAEERARARGITLRRGVSSDGALAEAVARGVLARLGAAADADRVVAEVLAALDGGILGDPAPGSPGSIDYCAAFREEERARQRRRAVITTTGRNQKGIVARLTAVIAELDGDILDISQTLVSDYFTMILVVDTATLACPFSDFKEKVETACREMGIQCMVLHEDIVTSLSRV